MPKKETRDTEACCHDGMCSCGMHGCGGRCKAVAMLGAGALLALTALGMVRLDALLWLGAIVLAVLGLWKVWKKR